MIVKIPIEKIAYRPSPSSPLENIEVALTPPDTDDVIVYEIPLEVWAECLAKGYVEISDEERG